MNKKDIVLEYYKHDCINLKSLKDRILSLNDLSIHLSDKGLVKKDTDEELMRFIIDIICISDLEEKEELALKSYLAHYVVEAIRDVMGSEKVVIPKVKENKEVKYDYETIDVKPEDVPDKQYDWEFLKLIGVENPE